MSAKYELAFVPAEYKHEITGFGKKIVIKLQDKSVNLCPLPNAFEYVSEEAEGGSKVSFITKLNIKKNFNNVFTNKLHNTYVSHFKNALAGLKTPYEKRVVIMGVGYKFYDELKTNSGVRVSVGYCNQIFIDLKKYLNDVSVEVAKDSMNITVKGADKFLVGEVAAKFTHIKKFNRYNMTGVRYHDQEIARKEVSKKN